MASALGNAGILLCAGLCPCDEPLDLARTGLTIGEPSASMRPRKHRALTPLREVTETTPPCVLAVRR